MVSWFCRLEIHAIVIILLFFLTVSCSAVKRPNIVFLLADDLGRCKLQSENYKKSFPLMYFFLGFNDVPWNNPKVKAPNLSALAAKGTVLVRKTIQ